MGILKTEMSNLPDSKHIRATGIVSLAGFLVNAFWAIANGFLGTTLVAAENTVVAVGFLSGFLIVRAGQHHLASFIVSLAFLAHMLFVAFTFGYGSGAHHFLLLGTVIPYLMFPRAALPVANGFAVLSGLAYLGCVAFRDRLPGTAVVGDEATMAIVNAGFLLAILAAATVFFVSQMRKSDDAFEAEHARSEALLNNLLPTEIAARLKQEPGSTIADELPDVAILFADLVGFTERSSRMQPEEIIAFLNGIFTKFDALAESCGVEKIKTIGDSYMAAAGMPLICEDPVHRVAELALAMVEVTDDLPDGVQLRIGLHAGPVVAGVIGKSKPFYDVWGETVNTASRMESQGIAGRIQITGTARAALGNDYSFEPRGDIPLKGLRKTETWWLTGRRPTG